MGIQDSNENKHQEIGTMEKEGKGQIRRFVPGPSHQKVL